MKSNHPTAAKIEVEDPAVLTRPEINREVLNSIDPQTLEDSFVYVHCYYDAPGEDALIRIWKTTFLVDSSSSTKSPLLHAENISMAPQWTTITNGKPFSFLLIFGGLPKSCKRFDLHEQIAQPGGFLVKNISRNETDVYHIHLR